MVDSVGGVGSGASRAQTGQASGLRNNPAVLNDIIRTQQRVAGARNVTALAVPQTSKGSDSGKVKVPRGSLVDVLA